MPGSGKKLGRFEPAKLSDVKMTPLGFSLVTPWISTVKSADAHAMGNLTSVRNPEIPTVTTCASFC